MVEINLDAPLEKSKLVEVVAKHNVHLREEFEAGRMHYITYGTAVINPGVPQMLLTAVSKFSGKNQDNLILSDLLTLYEAVPERDSAKMYLSLKKFSKEHGLFFGGSQYFVAREYLRSLGVQGASD